MKTITVILALALLAIGVIFFFKECNLHPVKTDIEKQNDVLKDEINKITVEGEARYKQDSGLIHNLTIALDTTATALKEIRKQFDTRGKQILATNKELHAALIAHDTPRVYTNCEYLSFQIDSIAQVKWDVDRELDKQIVLNEQLRLADSTALVNCRNTLRQTQQDDSRLALSYELQNQEDQKAIRRSKKGRWFFGFVGALIGGGIRSFIK